MSIDTAHRYLICYDITDDARRIRLAKVLQAYGDRIQYSVFVVDAKPAKLVRLRAQIEDLIHPILDSVLICELGPHNERTMERMEFVGHRRRLTTDGPLIV